MLFHYNLLSILVFIYWGVEYNSYNTTTRDMTKYTHSRESCVYFSHIPRKHVITIKYVTGSGKPNTIAHFSNSCLLNNHNLISQVYPLAKCQPHMPITLGVTALQSSNNRTIDLYSKYRENKLQGPTKMVITYQ